MPAYTIVERLDVVGNVFNGKLPSFVNVFLDSLLLQATEEGFRHSVVPAVAFAAHARLEMVCLAEPPPSVATKLRALIRVD